jgi:quercetin dioxygenase-like cupin family protein
VLRVHLNPQDRLEMHSHPSLILVALTPNSRRVFSPDSTQQDLSGKAGDVAWREPLSHAVQNLGDSFENIEIEFKKASGPAVPGSPWSAQRAPAASSADVPVEQEPHHKVLFENQYARVLDVQIPPGESLAFHTHAHDNLSVRISGGLIQNQIQGSEWQPTSEVKPGAVVFAEASNKPYTHRVKNLGTGIYHVVDVELLP